jgi:glycerol uptake facilitator protein
MYETGRLAIAEAYGTFVLVLIGPGTVVAVKLLDNLGPMTPAGLGFISLAHGFALMAVIYSVGHISGAYINPAVTIAAWMTKQLQTSKAFFYILAQFFGASVAGFTQLALWSASSNSYEAAKITFLGNTSPGPAFTVPTALLAEIIGTAVLVFTIFGATDKKTGPSPSFIGIPLVLAGLNFALIPISGASLNPARTWGPTVASLIFSFSPLYTFWIYVTGPIVGGLIGGFLYQIIRKP